jgi:hypothetical protein
MSSSGGEDSFIVRLAIFCTVITLVSTMAVNIFLPSYDAYSFEDVATHREGLYEFTGETMTNQSPWLLTGVFTPYVIGDEYGTTPEGWVYGDRIEDFPYLNESSNIKLDPMQKSSIPISVGKQQPITEFRDAYKWYYATAGGDKVNLIGKIAGFFGADLTKDVAETTMYNAWNYTGYRYEFVNMLPFSYDEQGNNKPSAERGALSIVWYNYGGHEGLSGGLVIYGKNNVLLASYSASDIINSYDALNSHSTKYVMNFEGVKLNLNIRFDPDVINSGKSLGQAWTEGNWSLAITSISAGNFMDIANSASFTDSIGGMLSTFTDIFTFDLPDVPWHYSLFLWLIVSLPAMLAILLFCSRFGIAGMAGGLIASTLLFGGGWF